MSEFKLNIERIQSNPDYSSDQLYLIESIDDASGFLIGGNKVYFAIKNLKVDDESISTTYLSLKTNIHINTIENSPTFVPGYYDLVIYDISADDSYLESFVELCKMYSGFKSSMDFVDFFYSLLKLFEPSKEASYSNLIGAYGELIFIKTVYEKYGIALDKNWHNSFGSNDKYDFSFNNFNLEIKTTIKEDKRFSIKHSQIFNEKNNFVSVVNIDQDNSGSSIGDIFEFFKHQQPFAGNIEFIINLEKEKRKIAPIDFYSKKFSLTSINVFSNKEIETIKNVPQCIDSITYMYDFVGQPSLPVDVLIKHIITSWRQ